jgi:hypothetical protein
MQNGATLRELLILKVKREGDVIFPTFSCISSAPPRSFDGWKDTYLRSKGDYLLTRDRDTRIQHVYATYQGQGWIAYGRWDRY